MSVYEFDQTFRFLECKIYWDVPWSYEVLAQLYCHVLFALRIMLRKVQKTDISASYVKRVFRPHDGLSPDGKTAMKLALSAALDVAHGRSILYLMNANRNPNSDILDSNDGRTFSSELFEFIRENHSFLSVTELQNPRPRTRGQRQTSLNDLSNMVSTFIDKFWSCVEARMVHTNTDCELTSFSEAPAETFFSKWQFVIDHRPSLLVKHVIGLCRIMLEGPDPGTQVSHDITRKALTLWDSHLGERYTTKEWTGGISKGVADCQNKHWKFAAHTDFS